MHAEPRPPAATAANQADPRLDWQATATPRAPGRAPALRHHRDGILPAAAAALSVRGSTYTCAGSKPEQAPALHPLVRDFLDALPVPQRERFTGRCPEAVLLSQYLTTVDDGRSKRASRKALSLSEAKRALKHAKLTTRRIREDGDPEHGSFAPPCRSCAPMLDHFGVRTVDGA
nr:YwqJ-related putative deaminase [Wenjunlia tyrosinilytica]